MLNYNRKKAETQYPHYRFQLYYEISESAFYICTIVKLYYLTFCNKLLIGSMTGYLNIYNSCTCTCKTTIKNYN